MKRTLSLAALSAVVMLALSGCSQQPTPGAETPSGAASESTEIQAVDGCGEEADFSLASDVEAGPARCEPGAPAAIALDEPAKVTIAIASQTGDYAAPYFVGIQEGEFEAEGIDLEIQVLPTRDALPLVAGGQLDGLASANSAGVYNSVSQGVQMRMLLGQGWIAEDSLAGVWARGGDTEVEDLGPGTKFGSAVGAGSAANVDLFRKAEEVGVDMKGFEYIVVAPADTVLALQNGSVDAAMILDPFWLELENDPDFHRLASSVPAGSDNGGFWGGPSLLDRPDVAAAFVRAYVRTVNTYFSGDYKADAENLEIISAATGVEPDAIARTPSFVFNWDVPTEMTDAHQEMFIDLGESPYATPLPEDELVDRSFVETAVGRERP